MLKKMLIRWWLLLVPGLLAYSCTRSVEDLRETLSHFESAPVVDYQVSRLQVRNGDSLPVQNISLLFVPQQEEPVYPYYFRIEAAGDAIGLFCPGHYVETNPLTRVATAFALAEDSLYRNALISFPYLEHNLPEVMDCYARGLQSESVRRLSDSLIGDTRVRRYLVGFHNALFFSRSQGWYQLCVDPETALPVEYSAHFRTDIGVSYKNEDITYRIDSLRLSGAPSDPPGLNNLPGDYTIRKFRPDIQIGQDVYL